MTPNFHGAIFRIVLGSLLAMTTLSVNINKIATLRNSRGHDFPNVAQVAEDLIDMGAQGLTIHPRPDERHIRRKDAYDLSRLIRQFQNEKPHLEFNIEGYPSDDFLKLIEEIRPEQATLVPDPPHVLTSNAGWNLTQSEFQLKPILSQLRSWNVRSSLFVDPQDNGEQQFASLKRLKPDRIELYTEQYAKDFASGARESAVATYQTLAQEAHSRGIGINAGHDLNQQNLGFLIEKIPLILEVSIGHAFVVESLYSGFQTTLDNYHKILLQSEA